MKRITPVAAVLFAASLFGLAACSGGAGGMGCGGASEESLDKEADQVSKKITTTCGGGTHLEGNTCVKTVSAPSGN